MSFYLVNETTGLVMDIKDGNPSSGAEIVMMQKNGRPCQHWDYRNGQIVNKWNKLVMHVSGSDCCSLEMRDSTGRPNQKWKFNHDGTIECGINKVLDITGQNKNKGAKVIGYDNNGGWNQKFRKIPV